MSPSEVFQNVCHNFVSFLVLFLLVMLDCHLQSFPLQAQAAVELPDKSINLYENYEW